MIAVRNVGTGIGVLHGLRLHPEGQLGGTVSTPLDEFTPQSRDHIAPG